jgi:hypothetical protein
MLKNITPDKIRLILFSILFISSSIIATRFQTWLTPVTGDEPFYLMTAISIWRDYDLDESNNYDQKQYLEFSPPCSTIVQSNFAGELTSPGFMAPGLLPCSGRESWSFPLPPHNSTEVKQSGMFTKHGLGLSILIAPFYALSGRSGVMLVLTIIYSLLGVNIFMLLNDIYKMPFLSSIVTLATILSCPFICYSSLIFPSLTAALLFTYSFRQIRLLSMGEKSLTPTRYLLVGLSIGILPWLHSIYILLSVPLVLYYVCGKPAYILCENCLNKVDNQISRNQSKGYWLLWTMLAITFSGIIYYYLWLYGTPLPNTQDHAGFTNIDKLPLNALGLILDQKWGLLPFAPIYFIAFIGIVLFYFDQFKTLNIRQENFGKWSLYCSITYLIVIASYNQWWGEWCPPSRYIVPVLPLLIIYLQYGIMRLNVSLKITSKILFTILGAYTFLVTCLILKNPKLMYHWQDNGQSKIFTFVEKILAIKPDTIGYYFPSFVTNLNVHQEKFNETLINIAWIAILITTVSIIVVLTKKNCNSSIR